MHVEQLERLPALQSWPEHDLRQLLARLRSQLGCERLALYALRGTLAGSLALIALSLATWLAGAPRTLWSLSITPLAAALVLGFLRWPSPLDAAKAFDRHAGLEERLATATELLDDAHPGRFDVLQMRDAVRRGEAAPRVWLAFNTRTRIEAGAAVLMLALAAVSVALVPGLPRFGSTPVGPTLVTDAVAPDTTLQERASPLDTSSAATESAPKPNKSAVPDLASRVQQEQAEGTALDKLAQGLSDLSAGQAAADALRQGDFASAGNELRNLGDNADQLSRAAKQQLARGLQAAAAVATQADPALANREQKAAQALTRSTYVDQRQALQALADQVQRSGAQSVPSGQLQRELGQLQQQQSGTPTDSSDGSGYANGSATTGQSGGGAGDQGGPGIGTGVSANPFLDQPSRLATQGQQVRVPTKLGNGPGVRPADASDDSSSLDPSLTGRSASELPQTQQTGQVAPEQNLVPGEQRPLVRGYFR